MFWNTSRFAVDLSIPKIMGIVNVTPDSFTDGGQHDSTTAAMRHCEQLIRDGANILDIGGESTRPGATPVAVEEELSRILPVLRFAVTLGVPVSVDTYKPQVMQAALDLGVDIINDVWALRWTPPDRAPTALRGRDVVSTHPTCGVCLMHMHLEPMSMQVMPMQGDVVNQVTFFLQDAADGLHALGVAKSRIVIDPGIGFGKTVTQNFELLARQRALLACGYPLASGWSRKSSLATVLGDHSGHQWDAHRHPRMVASVAAALLAVDRGATVVRVHDVLETAEAFRVRQTIL